MDALAQHNRRRYAIERDFNQARRNAELFDERAMQAWKEACRPGCAKCQEQLDQVALARQRVWEAEAVLNTTKGSLGPF